MPNKLIAITCSVFAMLSSQGCSSKTEYTSLPYVSSDGAICLTGKTDGRTIFSQFTVNNGKLIANRHKYFNEDATQIFMAKDSNSFWVFSKPSVLLIKNSSEKISGKVNERAHAFCAFSEKHCAVAITSEEFGFLGHETIEVVIEPESNSGSLDVKTLVPNYSVGYWQIGATFTANHIANWFALTTSDATPHIWFVEDRGVIEQISVEFEFPINTTPGTAKAIYTDLSEDRELVAVSVSERTDLGKFDTRVSAWRLSTGSRVFSRSCVTEVPVPMAFCGNRSIVLCDASSIVLIDVGSGKEVRHSRRSTKAFDAHDILPINKDSILLIQQRKSLFDFVLEDISQGNDH